jgi:organic radical activating enzyme
VYVVRHAVRELDARGEDVPVAGDRPPGGGARARHVVLTGGEPMIMPDVADLCDALKAAGQHVTIETAATVWKDVPHD